MGAAGFLQGWLQGTPRKKPAGPELTAQARLAVSSLTILAALLFGFLAQVTILGALKHNRDQQVAYDDLRLTLAEGTAPVGPAEGKPIGKGTPLARLTIPAIGVKEVVLAGTTAGVLRSGIGHRRDTVLPGQAGTSILMGRRMAYGGPFSQISTLAPQDEIRIVTGQGEVSYRVVGVRRAGQPQPAPSAARLTLLTTDGSRFAPTDVLRVDADLVGTPHPASTPHFTSQTLPADERALRGEPDALGGVVGWGLLLTIGAVATTWLRDQWGRWQAWLVAVPTLGLLGTSVADHAVRFLPNLL